MLRTLLLSTERLRLLRAVILMTAAVLLFGYATGAYGLDPPRVVDAYGRARGEGDIDRAVGLFADNAVMQIERGRTQSFAGKAQIRNFLVILDAEATPVVTATPKDVGNNTVTWSERGDSVPTRELTGEAVVQGGKITSLVYRSGTLVPTEANTAASATPLPTGAMLGALVLFGIGLVSLVTVRSRRVSRSALRGRLVRQLRNWRARRLRD